MRDARSPGLSSTARRWNPTARTRRTTARFGSIVGCRSGKVRRGGRSRPGGRCCPRRVAFAAARAAAARARSSRRSRLRYRELTRLLAAHGYAVDGIDFSAAMVRRAVAKIREFGSVTISQTDAGRPPLPTGSYDAVLSRHVLWAMSDPAASLGSWEALLRPGGSLVTGRGALVYRRRPDIRTGCRSAP